MHVEVIVLVDHHMRVELNQMADVILIIFVIGGQEKHGHVCLNMTMEKKPEKTVKQDVEIMLIMRQGVKVIGLVQIYVLVNIGLVKVMEDVLQMNIVIGIQVVIKNVIKNWKMVIKLEHGEMLDVEDLMGMLLTLLKNVKVNASKYQGYAFGIGIDRLAMLKYGINDLRAFFDTDYRWISHFGFDPLDVPSNYRGLSR